MLLLGRAVYRTSGSLLRVDAQAVESAEGQASLFSRVPPPRLEKVTVPRAAGRGQGWQAFSSYFGKWPGTETDEEWAAILEERKA